MKVYVDPIPKTLSRAMYRVAKALKDYSPPEIEIVSQPINADIQILHVIGDRGKRFVFAKKYAIIQYCYLSGKTISEDRWDALWNDAKFIWSYYDLKSRISENRFLHAPLGIDSIFANAAWWGTRRKIGVITSGYVNGKGAEAISEVAEAAYRLGMKIVHLGPTNVKDLYVKKSWNWEAAYDITDVELVELYEDALWVSGLRHVEGFELPALEGLSCGARPILFDRSEMKTWYSDHGEYVSEEDDEEKLTESLVKIMSEKPRQISEEERKEIVEKFDWKKIVGEFWEGVLREG